MDFNSPNFDLIWRDPARRRRVIAFLIVVVVETLIIFALLLLGNLTPPPRKLQSDLVALSLGMPKAETEKRKSSAAPAKQKPVAPAAAKKTPEILPPQPKPTPNMVPMSKEDFAASDIGKLGKAGSAGSKAAYGPGDGPGGQTLYPAEWYREPGPNVLADSLPTGAPEGAWAMIACRTIENYRVENCVGMGESHVGLALALRKAAWQFQVLPPRVNGRPLIGAWVRIRFDFTKKTGD
jgi:hypothetical protein